MEKITSFQITSLTLSGFRCFVEPVTFQFGQMNLITGHNGLGKSSLADAIAFAVTGVPFFGGTGLDRLYYDQGEKELTVDLSLTDGDGTRHRLTRHRKNNTMSITWDGMAIRQSDLTEMFGERDIFLSMFNPLYFIERLGEQGRDLLERYLPAISHEAVLEQLDDRSRGLLEGVEMRSPQGYLTKLREDIREAESTATYLQGQRDMLEEQEKTRADALLAAQSKLETATIRAAELEAQRACGGVRKSRRRTAHADGPDSESGIRQGAGRAHRRGVGGVDRLNRRTAQSGGGCGVSDQRSQFLCGRERLYNCHTQDKNQKSKAESHRCGPLH